LLRFACRTHSFARGNQITEENQMTEQDLLDMGFTKSVMFHMHCFTKGSFTIWFNTKNQELGFYCEYPEGNYVTQLTIRQLNEIFPAAFTKPEG
jgi:hypothetical protein